MRLLEGTLRAQRQGLTFRLFPGKVFGQLVQPLAMGKGDRPELSAPPELFYDDTEAAKYTKSSRVMEIQEKLTLRALELLALEDDGTPKMILDVGCGSGLSGEVLTEEGAERLPLMCQVKFPLTRLFECRLQKACRAHLDWLRHLSQHA